MNNVLLVGRVVKDPELRYTESKTPVTNLSLAVSKEYKKDDQKLTDFFNITCWNKLAEIVSEYCKKGDLISVEARIQNKNYEDKEGNKHYELEIVAERIAFLSSYKGGDQNGN